MAMNQQELSDLIALGEGFTIEFKRAFAADLGRELCAFANATGGTVLIGVEDSGEIVGVSKHNALKSKIQTIARSADPPIAIDVMSVARVLCVKIPEQHGKPYSYAGKFFLREGANSQQLARNEIREFFFKEGLIRFDETHCPSFRLEEDLTDAGWARFARRARIPEVMTSREALENLHLLKNGGMTYAGAWLLADDITRHTLRAGVTCALFQGTTKTRILDRKDFTRDLFSIFEDCIAYIQSKLNTELIPHARGRHERLELPENALREALVNAIAHRDYRSTANVQIYIFRDRLEVVTPGGLPAGMREEDLGMKSVPRNPLLFGMLHRMGLVEQVGSGIRRMLQLCRDYGVTAPLIDVSECWVTMTFARKTEKQSAESHEAMDESPQKPYMKKAKTLHETGENPTRKGQKPYMKKAKTLHETGENPTRTFSKVEKLVSLLNGEPTRTEIMHLLGLKDRANVLARYIRPALEEGFIEMTIPDQPRNRQQKYRLTDKGRALKDKLKPPS